MRRLSGYPHWFFAMLMLTVALLFLTGLLLVPTLLEMRLEWDTLVHLESDVRGWVAVLHTTTAFITMGLLGALSVMHMRMGWRRQRNRVSGIGLVLLFGILLVTAITIFYAGDEEISRLASVLHTIIGVFIITLFGWHLVNGRRIRQLLTSQSHYSQRHYNQSYHKNPKRQKL